MCLVEECSRCYVLMVESVLGGVFDVAVTVQGVSVVLNEN